MRKEDAVQLTLHIQDARGKVKIGRKGFNAVELPAPAYEEGDCIVLEVSRWPVAVCLRLDDHIGEAEIWLTADKLEFPIPFGEGSDAYPPNAFTAGSTLRARIIDNAQWRAYRNLSVNPLDKRGDTTYYPHCTANVETRDESVFAARNTIDGIVHPECHGAWPYQSWGENENSRAEIMIAFGREVMADKAEIHLRADFPHDNFWKQATLLFSDGSREVLALKKTGEGQNFAFSSRKISWVKLTNLIKGEEESPFPALTQWAIYGWTE